MLWVLIKLNVHKLLQSIVSYCDKRFFLGNVYKKSGFKEIQSSKPNYLYIGSGFTVFYSRVMFQKHKLFNMLENFDPRKTEMQNMTNNGYDRIWDCGNKVFVLGGDV